MDLGIAGRTALVCASSRGLGSACAWQLARSGCNLVINGRDTDMLRANGDAIRRETGVQVRCVTADINDEDAVATLLGEAGAVDILVNNNGGGPARDFRDVRPDDLRAGLAANMIAPILLTQGVLTGMVERGFGRVVCITSIAVKQAIPGLEISSGARIGLTGYLAGVARAVAHANVTINFLLPGAFDTDRSRNMVEASARNQGISENAAWDQALAGQPTGRIGRPDEFGAACAFLCSAQAGYITGQSLLMDGGAFAGIL